MLNWDRVWFISMGELGELNLSKLKGFVLCVCNLFRE